ncbi:hypothetical protein [Apilactobacillus sp. EABW-1NA]|uniref:hypothetical protein n=1 Tax=Apilactobacillus sp. EABW-1NA TaxID=2984137 RepID=UPI0025B10F36|nr:hypothetical protein [Apilactobacillus sp. EABW-1NA]MDN2612985.1 hypothetical protein [Apilactobacillus sp. EABW-1NA]
MKTIKDLVNKLNNYVAYGEFYIRKGKNNNYLLYARNESSDDSTVFDFAKQQPYWSIYPRLGSMHNQVQEDIMDFVYNTDKDHWFDEPEKKYNIIVGKELEPSAIQKWESAYMKTECGLSVRLALSERDFIKDEFIFTESEIEELKYNLPENMAKIVDLGKAEVK